MEDVLDEWISALLKSQTDEEDRNSFTISLGKVCHPSISCFDYGNTNVIKDRFGDIAEEKDRYPLASMEIGYSRRVESAYFTKVSQFRVCDVLRNELIRGLLCDRCDQGENDMNMISVGRMGGVGKNNSSTTCLQRW